MGRYGVLGCIILFALPPGLAACRGAAASHGTDLPRDDLLSVLFGRDEPLQPREDLERHMATVSIIMGLLALGVAVSTLVWCQKLAEGVTRLRTNPSDADVRQRLAELASEFPSLHARADHLRQCWQADTSKLESIIRQLENRMAELEQGHRGLATMSKDLDSLRDSRTEVESVVLQLATRTAELEQGYRGLGALTKDLDSLRDFRSHVERVHAGIQKAFNGALSGITVPALPDDERPPRDG